MSAPAVESPAEHGGRVHYAPSDQARVLWSVVDDGPSEIDRAVRCARHAQADLAATPFEQRVAVLKRLADTVSASRDLLTERLADEVGKPVTIGSGEVAAASGFLRSCIHFARSNGPRATAAGYSRRRPRGVVALITPWNNPLAIALGKIGPALIHGNAVVWKPAPEGLGVAEQVMALPEFEDLPQGAISLVRGGAGPGKHLARHAGTDAVSVTGSIPTGLDVATACASRLVPLQAELGGNNAAIVWSDCDHTRAAGQIARGAFSFAGQRCTANRRVIVEAGCAEPFLAALEAAASDLVCGDPHDPRVTVGPMISTAARDRVVALVERARALRRTRASRYATRRGRPCRARRLRDPIDCDVRRRRARDRPMRDVRPGACCPAGPFVAGCVAAVQWRGAGTRCIPFFRVD